MPGSSLAHLHQLAALILARTVGGRLWGPGAMAHLDTGLMEEHLSLSHTDMQTLTHYAPVCVCVLHMGEENQKKLISLYVLNINACLLNSIFIHVYNKMCADDHRHRP